MGQNVRLNVHCLPCAYDSHYCVVLDTLCLKANAEMVPKIPSCHYMLLM